LDLSHSCFDELPEIILRRRVEKIGIARKMLIDGKPAEEIIKYTGLSQGEIESLQTKSP
jgi:hypothetical protein